MAILGFIAIALFLAWLTAFGAACIFGQYFITGRFGGESVFGVVIFIVCLFTWKWVIQIAPFTITLSSL